MDHVFEHSLLAIASCLPVAVWSWWMVRRERTNRAVRRRVSWPATIIASVLTTAGLGWALFVGLLTYGLGCTAKGGYNCEDRILIAVSATCILVSLWLVFRGWRAARALRRSATA